MKTCYEILGVENNTPKEEIRRAYFRLALKYHPDKNNSQDIKRFLEIQKAYKECIDDNKRVDKFQFKDSYIFYYFFNLYQYIKNSYNTPLYFKIDVPLEDIYYHRIKKITLKVKRNNELVNIDLYISLLMYEETYIFKEMGDDFPFIIKGKKRNDIHVAINIIKMKGFKISDLINKYDLYIEKSVSLYTYLFLEELSINIFKENTEYIKFNCTDNCTDNCEDNGKMKCIVLQNKGLPFLDKDDEDGIIQRANLYIYVSVNFNIKNKEYLHDDNFKSMIEKYYLDSNCSIISRKPETIIENQYP